MTDKEREEKVAEFKAITKEMAELYEAKNHDYGDSFTESLDKWGLIAAVVRMSDKVNRLGSLADKSEIAKVNEKLTETATDLAAYAVMTTMWLKNHRV